MSDISKALQGKMSPRKGHVKEQNERQLDLFSSLAEREPSSPKVVPASRPEPEMILPPSASPPDVAADVRAVLSESGSARPVEAAAGGDETRPLITGIYRRPSRPAAIPLPPRPAPPPASRLSPVRWLRDWLAGVELNRRMIALWSLLPFWWRWWVFGAPARAARSPNPAQPWTWRKWRRRRPNPRRHRLLCRRLQSRRLRRRFRPWRRRPQRPFPQRNGKLPAPRPSARIVLSRLSSRRRFSFRPTTYPLRA